MPTPTQSGTVDLDIQNGIGTITFFHPSHNSLPSLLLNELAATITAAGEDEKVQVIILKSGGERTFCAGASFDELMQIEDVDTGKEFFMGFAKVINACRRCKNLIIGRVQGKAVGGGVGVAAAVDYCFATQYAAVRLSELAVGIGPFVVGPAVERKIGISAMSQLAVNATVWQAASWAKDKGLYAEVYDTTEKMDEAVQALAECLAASNPDALAELKTIFWEGTEHWDKLLEERAEKSGRLVLSSFAKEAIQQFKSK
ncbi:MAG: enoyl-CoA hydratase/isomerase family protein [Bacteroidota bacterium]